MQVSKWGNSLAVRLPVALVDKLKLKDGDHVQLEAIERGRLGLSRQAEIDAAFEKLRSIRGRVPAGYKFNRDDANRR